MVEYSYKKIGTGYCTDWVYLPEGGYPGFLPSSDSLSVPEDRIEECMLRCLSLKDQNGANGNSGNKKIADKAFYVNSKNKCACSSGSCNPTGSGYVSYKIVATTVVKQGNVVAIHRNTVAVDNCLTHMHTRLHVRTYSRQACTRLTYVERALPNQVT